MVTVLRKLYWSVVWFRLAAGFSITTFSYKLSIFTNAVQNYQILRRRYGIHLEGLVWLAHVQSA